jgi:serine/threonine-protein kinase/endoribonuclease IRE1
MLETDPTTRLNCDAVLSHPFFWPSDKKLAFLADVSDRLERSDRRSPTNRRLESTRPTIFPSMWTHLVDPALSDDLNRYRKYFGSSVQDLLRAMRNKRHHFQELPAEVRAVVGETPQRFFEYFERRFPALLITVYRVVKGSVEWRGENPFKDVYFS